MKKIYVLDTNILISDPNAIFGFEDNDVVITQTTLQELDNKKTAPGEVGYNTREAIRNLEKLREKAIDKDLTKPVDLNDGGQFWIEQDSTEYLPTSLSPDVPDNRIIGTVLYLKAKSCEDVILVTNDVSMILNASSAHVAKVEKYKNDHVTEEANKYSGITILKGVDEGRLDEIKSAIGGLSLDCYFDEERDFGHKLTENEYVAFEKNEIWKATDIMIAQNGYLRYIPDSVTSDIYGVKPKNATQKAVLCALTAQVSDIPLVILKGPAGCAKTFLSVAAGIDSVFEGKYDRVMITRTNVLSDAEFGFLPGELSDKMGPLLAPFYDNLANLIKNQEPKESIEDVNLEVQDLFDSGKVEICAMAYMRGRSISNTYLIVDEAQNATRSQIRDIITRAGTGTKIVLCGDPSQIDAHNLDSLNNGLVFAAQKFKGNPLCAQLTFTSDQCVRSPLAKEAIDVLKL